MTKTLTEMKLDGREIACFSSEMKFGGTEIAEVSTEMNYSRAESYINGEEIISEFLANAPSIKPKRHRRNNHNNICQQAQKEYRHNIFCR